MRKKNCSLYKYGGAVSPNLIIVDTANIKFCDLYDKLYWATITDEALVKKLKETHAFIEKQNLRDSITLSDDRLVFLFNKIMYKFPEAIKEHGLIEWFIVYRFWTAYYDSGVPYIDILIRFLNLYMGYTFTTGVISEGEINELDMVAKNLKAHINHEDGIYLTDVPKFVRDAIEAGIKLPVIEESAEQEIKEITKSKEEKTGEIFASIEALKLMAEFSDSTEEKEKYLYEAELLQEILDGGKFKDGGKIEEQQLMFAPES